MDRPGTGGGRRKALSPGLWLSGIFCLASRGGIVGLQYFIDSIRHSSDYTKRARNSGQSEEYLLVSLPWGDYFPIVMEDHPGLGARIFEAVWAPREFGKRNIIFLAPESFPPSTFF